MTSRLLFLNDDAVPHHIGGAAVVMQNLRLALAQEGMQSSVITTHQDRSRGNEVRWQDQAGDIISIYREPAGTNEHRRCIRDAAVDTHMERLMNEIKPTVVHAHNIHSNLTYECLRIAKKHTDNIFLTAHDSYLVSFGRVNSEKYRNAALHEKAIQLNQWNHLFIAGRKYAPHRNQKIRTILKETQTTVITYSHAMQRFLEANGIQNPHYIASGMPLPELPSDDAVKAARKKWNLEGPTILFAGRISPDKGILSLLHAFEHVREDIPEAHLLIVGKEERLKPHLERVSTATANAIRCTGWIEAKDMNLAYRAADVVTVPSLYLDNFPTVNLEAMAMERPVIGTCFGGTPEAIIDDETGIILDPRDAHNFANTMKELLSDESKRARMGTNGRKRVAENFSAHKYVAAHKTLYSTVH